MVRVPRKTPNASLYVMSHLDIRLSTSRFASGLRRVMALLVSLFMSRMVTVRVASVESGMIVGRVGAAPLGDGRGASIGGMGGGANGSSKPNDGAGLGTRKGRDGVRLAAGESGEGKG